MQTTDNRYFKIVYIILAALFLIRFLPFLDPSGRFWGFNALLFLPHIYTITFAVIAAIALALPFTGRSSRMGETLTDSFSEIFYESNHKYIYRSIFILIMTGLFIIFAAPTHFLGDGYTALANMASGFGTVYKWSEKGITFLLSIIQSLIGPKNRQTALISFQIASVLSGIVTIWFFFLIADILTDSKIKKITIFILSLFSAVLLLFFGYVENYPLVWIALSGFIYYAIRYLKSGRGLYISLLFLLFGIFIHLQMGIFIPAYIYILFSGEKGTAIFRKFRYALLGLAALTTIAAGILFVYKFRTDLYFEDIFLRLFTGKGFTPNYYVFSLPHIIDIINEYLLLSPLLLILLVLSIRNLPSILHNKRAIFLTLVSIAGILFLLFIDPKLTMPRDWDLFSFAAFGLTILLILLIRDKYFGLLNRFMPTLIIYLLVACLPFLLVNLKTDPSINYIKYMIKLDPTKSLSSLVIMREYYRDLDDEQKADSLTALIVERFPNDKKVYDAFAALKRGDVQKAQRITNTIKPDKFSGDYHNYLSALYLYQHKYNEALEESDKAIQLQKYKYRYYINRSFIYASMGKNEKSLEAMRDAYDLNFKDRDVLNGLARVHLLSKNYDSTMTWARKMLKVDSSYTSAYYFLSFTYAKEDKPDSAAKYFNLFRNYGRSAFAYQYKLSELKQLLESL